MTLVEMDIHTAVPLDHESAHNMLRPQYFNNVHGPLPEAAGNYENQYFYQYYANKEEPRRIMAHIAMKLPLNTLGEHRGDEA
jgi:hypothetical protein